MRHNNDEILWCNYCKEEIHPNENKVKVNGKDYHLDCWKIDNDIYDELDFPTGDFDVNAEEDNIN